MRIAVVVPSYRRVRDLGRCLAALRVQRRSADEVLVVLRRDDAEALAMVDELRGVWSALRAVHVERAGVVAAMNAGLDAATAEVLALTDDDAEPAEDWLERLHAVLAVSPDVAGAGGRDDQAGVAGERPDVGRVQWVGRVIGNHHLGAGPARDVDVLKGVNCAFRTELVRAVRFDERLLGEGAQPHWELALCLALRRAGWRLRYDPAIRVRHHVAPRTGSDQLHRGRFDAAPHAELVYNETFVLAQHLSGVRGGAFRVWASLVGTGSAPGLAQLPRVLVQEGRTALLRWRATQRGRREGWRAGRSAAAATAPTRPARGLPT